MEQETITLVLPEEFIALCADCGITPAIVLRGFIADVADIMNWGVAPRADGYSSNGSDERMLAQAYFDRCGYAAMAAWRREALDKE